MKKKILSGLCVIIIIIGIFFIIKNNHEKKKLSYNIEQITETNFFLLLEDSKYGVINKNGDVIINPIYDIIEIPNPSKGLFICKNNYKVETGEYNIQVFNESGDQILYQYYIVEAIKLNEVQGNGNYEKTVLKYKSDGKYGLIDFDGNKITKPIYDSIEGFEYNEGLLLVEKSGKFGIININGATIIKEKYDEILSDGYYENGSSENKSGYIIGTRTDNGMRYGYIESKNRKQILKNEYNEIYRITDKTDENNIYLVAFKEGKAGVYQNKKNIISHDYEDILYNSATDLLILQRTSKQGVSKFDGTMIVPIQYDNVFFAGTYINAQKDDKIEIYTLDGTKQENPEYISRQSVENNKYEIVSTANDEYKIINNEDGNIVSNNYTYIQHLFNNYFSAMSNGKYGIIDSDGKELLPFKYNVIQLIGESKIIQTIDENTNIELLNENFDSIIKTSKANIYSYDSYIEVYTDDGITYINKSGNKMENTEVFSDNKLVTFKEENKYGFKDKNGNVVIKPQYQMATEINEYGYAGIKLNDKWGVIDSNGNIIKEPIYEFDLSIMPIFLKEYYKVDMGYGEPYFTNQ